MYLQHSKTALKPVAVSLVLIAVVYFAFTLPTGQRVVDTQNIYNDDDNSLEMNGKWEVLPYGTLNEPTDIYNQSIKLDDNLILIGNRQCQRLSTELTKSSAYIDYFDLKSNLNGHEQAIVWTTNCNNAGNVFATSEGSQSIVILDNRYIFLLYLKSEKYHLLQLARAIK